MTHLLSLKRLEYPTAAAGPRRAQNFCLPPSISPPLVNIPPAHTRVPYTLRRPPSCSFVASNTPFFVSLLFPEYQQLPGRSECAWLSSLSVCVCVRALPRRSGSTDWLQQYRVYCNIHKVQLWSREQFNKGKANASCPVFDFSEYFSYLHSKSW